MEKTTAVEALQNRNTPPFTLENAVCDILLDHAQTSGNLFTSSIASHYFHILHRQPEKFSELLPKLVKHLLITAEDANQKLLKHLERQPHGPVFILDKDNVVNLSKS